jgi:hypothetical protein
MGDFNHQNAVHDLTFTYEKGGGTDGKTPHICVSFEQAFGVALSFRCLRLRAIGRKSKVQANLSSDPLSY